MHHVFFEKATCSTFSWRFQTRKEKCSRAVLKTTRSQAKAHLLEKLDMSTILRATCLGGGVCELERWRPSVANSIRDANPARSGPGGSREVTENPQGTIANAESPKESNQASTPRRTICTTARKVKKTQEQAWAWTTLKKICQKNNAGGESSLGQHQEERRPPYDEGGPQKRIPRQR